MSKRLNHAVALFVIVAAGCAAAETGETNSEPPAVTESFSAEEDSPEPEPMNPCEKSLMCGAKAFVEMVSCISRSPTTEPATAKCRNAYANTLMVYCAPAQNCRREAFCDGACNSPYDAICLEDCIVI